jgi:hypothetical protein
MLEKRSYSELIALPTFEERLKYCQMKGTVGKETFGFERSLNQQFYHSVEWQRIRNEIIVRDNGCDLGYGDKPIMGKIVIHHLNPVTVEDIENVSSDLINPEYLICVSHLTHNAIHYGDERLIPKVVLERRPNDTCPWKW